MMLIKSPYDFMHDNFKAILKAEQGIEIKYEHFKDLEGVHRDLVINHQADKIMKEKLDLIQSQMELNEIVIKEWKSNETKKIKENPDNYLES